MQIFGWIAPLFIGLAVGALIAWLAARTRTARLEEQLHATSDVQREALAAMIERAKNELAQASEAIASAQRDQILELASQRFASAEERANAKLDDLVKPVQQKLGEFDALVREIETKRQTAYVELRGQVENLAKSGGELQSLTNALSTRTSELVSALRNPTTRGKWGEVQLRRVVELAGMLEHCDFNEQETLDIGDVSRRPDMTIQLPNESRVLVDAKVPLAAYLDAVESPDEPVRRERLRTHAAAFKNHIDALAKREYRRAEGSADFVVMFVPGEAFLSAACLEDPDLLEYGMEKGIFVTSPLTLIAILRSYALGWQQRRQEENIREIADIGRELYDRFQKFADHLKKLGGALGGAIDHYNRAVGSYETRLLPQGRKMREKASWPEDDLPELDVIDTAPRTVTALDAVPKRTRISRTQSLFPGEIDPGETA